MYQDIPEELNVTLYEGDRNSNQERGVLGSKATGEPATHMGISVAFAIRNAINAMKKEIDSEGVKWYSLGKSYKSHDDFCKKDNHSLILIEASSNFKFPLDYRCSSHARKNSACN